MRTLLSHRPSPATLISLLALFVALGGSAYAAVNLPANSVGTKQLKNGAVTANKLKGGAVTTAVIANHAVTGSKLNLSGVTVPKAAHAAKATHAGSATSANHAATAVSATSSGSAGALTGVQIVSGSTQTNAAHSQDSQVVSCPTGMQAISGGVADSGDVEEAINDVHIVSFGGGTDNAIDGLVNNNGGSPDTFHVWAVCIHGSVTGGS